MDKNETLANFQACTGIDDIGHCMVILEQYEWNLQSAVSATIAQQYHQPSAMNGSFPDHGKNGENVMLTFSCNLGAIAKDVTLDDSSTVGDLKEIASIELGVPLSEMQFENWPAGSPVSNPSDNTVLNTLHLPHFTVLNLKVRSPIPGVTIGLDSPDLSSFGIPCSAMQGQTSDFESLMKTFKLNITNKDDNTIHTLQCEGSKTVKELREDVIPITNISFKRQLWQGFPNENPPDNDLTLGSLNLNHPVHNLTIKTKNLLPLNSVKTSHSQLASSSSKRWSDASSENDEDTMEALDDELIFSTESFSSKRHSDLMPEKVEDVTSALQQFQSEFYSRYGEGPTFVACSLRSAVQQAFGSDARERKLLGVYIHHDKSIQSNVFCSQLLSKECISTYLNEHFITWAWDVTSGFNRERFLQDCAQTMGSGIADTIRKLKRDEFPVLILAQGKGRSCDVTAIIQGNSEVNELLAKLINAVDGAEAQRVLDIKEEDARKARERIKLEQEEAYRLSLAADRAKMLAEEEAMLKLQEEESQKRKDDDEKLEAAERLKSVLPPEPSPDCGKPISQVRFRAPDGSTFMRSFLASESLQTLVNFVGSKGFPRGDFRILKPWPKTNLSELDPTVSLETYKIFPQETLIIEETPECES